MYRGKRILAVVPARGGSKGVPMKNLKPLFGKPLVTLVADICREVHILDRCVVSTDHPEIGAVAKSSGLSFEFYRPENLSGDRIGDLEVLVHALEEMERIDGFTYEVIVMLQPTSPMRESADVQACVEKLVNEELDAVWTISEADPKYHPLKQLKVDESGMMHLYDEKGRSIIARQQLEKLYFRNGAAYAFDRKCLVEQRTTLGKRTGAVITKPMISIDTEWDFKMIEFYETQGQKQPK